MKRLVLLRIVIVALAALLTVSPADAQQGQPRRPRNKVQPEDGTQIPAGLRFADLKLGPVYFQPRIGLKQLGYDSNVLGSPSPFEISDFRVTALAGTKLVLPFRDNHVISGDAQVDYLWFADTDELRTFNGAFSGRYEYDTERLGADLYTRYIDAQRGQLDVISIGDDIVPPSYEIFGRLREVTLDAGVDLRFQVGRRIVIEPKALRRIIRYKDAVADAIDLADDLNRTEESLGGFLGYRLTSKTTVGIEGEYQINDYETPGNPRDAVTYRTGARIDLDESVPLHGTFLAGYRRLLPDLEGVVGFDGFSFEGDLVFAPRGVAEIALMGSRDVFPSFWRDSIYYLRQGGGASILFQVRRDLAVGGDFTYHEHEYPTVATAAQDDGTLLTARRLDKIPRAVAHFEWRQGNSNRLTFRIGWIERRSNFDVASTNGLVVESGYSLIY